MKNVTYYFWLELFQDLFFMVRKIIHLLLFQKLDITIIN